MNLKKNIFISLLLSIGFILSQITPPLLGGMRFNFLLNFMFIAIILTKDLKSSLLIGLLGGILCAITSTVPAGEFANLIDKITTSLYVFILVKNFNEITRIKLFFLSLTATLLSGSIFIFIANTLMNSPTSFKSLFIPIVLPSAFLNIPTTIFLFEIIKKSLKQIDFDFN